MTDQSASQKFTFTFSPSSREALLTQDNYVEIVIVAQNRSERPVRVHPILVPIGSESAFDSPPPSLAEWISWISFKEAESELDFEQDGAHTFNVLIRPPSNAPLGSYGFKLILSGVENPDEESAASDPITFTVAGPKLEMRAFAIGSAIILALVILGILAAVLFIRPRPSLEAVFSEVPQKAVQGKPITYKVNVKNPADEPARNVMIDYRLPDSVLAATAFVPDENLRHCDVDEPNHSIRCDLGNLSKNETITVDFQAVPGPAAVTITNTLAFTVSADTIKSFPVAPAASQRITRVSPAPGKYAVALMPSTSSPLLGENFTYQVLAWSTITNTQTLTFTFSLPPGMTYDKGNSDVDCHPSPDNDIVIVCRKSPLPFAKSNFDVTRLDLHVQATDPSTSPASLAISSPAPTYTLTTTTKVIDSALFFNGINDWAQLGYNQMPKNFTIEMWVHPYSSNDGQCFAGLHRVEPDGKVSDLFLVGYWFGSLHVNVKGTSYNLVTPKRTDRYHLAVVVEDAGNDRSKVNVYVNGEPQEWQQPETEDCGTDKYCKFFESSVTDVQNALPWVLGQDWDSGNLGKKTSDFFHGTLSEVRIWNEARSSDQVNATYRVRPRGDEKNLVAYYRLEPVDLETNTLPSRVATAQPGTRMGATWIELAPRYGMALQFSGPDQTLTAPGLLMDKLYADPSGQVDLTLAGWIKVNEIPTRQEWILGFVPTNTLQVAKSELQDAQKAADALNTGAIQDLSNAINTSQQLLFPLGYLRGNEGFPDTVMLSLKNMENAEQTLKDAISTTQQSNNSEKIADDIKILKSAQSDFANAAPGLDAWLQAEITNTMQISNENMIGQPLTLPILSGHFASYENVVNLNTEQANIFNLTTSLIYLQRYQDFQSVLEVELDEMLASQARIDAAQKKVVAAQAQFNQTGAPQPAVSAPWAGLMIDSDGYVMLVVRPTNGSDIIWKKDTKPLQLGKWVHYAAVIRYDPHTGKVSTDALYPPDSQGHTNNLPFLYRDGSLVKGIVDVEPSLVAISNIQCPGGFYLGGLCESVKNFYFTGQLDEVRIWNRALTVYQNANEIDTWRMLPGIASDEIAYWAFDDGPGNQTRDLSGDSSLNLNVRGPGWVEADAGLPTERP